MRIVEWSPADLRARLSEAMALYAEAMGYPIEAGQHRASFALTHTRRDGFRAMAALVGGAPASAVPTGRSVGRSAGLGTGPDGGLGGGPGGLGRLDPGELTGFGYGYATAPGQWWHDQVRAALPAAVADEWLTGCFELSELHVRPAYQGRGLGRALLTRLVDGLPHAAVLLSTPEGDTRAWRLYRSLGFVDLVRHHLFPGDARPFAVLGVRLPLAATPARPADAP